MPTASATPPPPSTWRVIREDDYIDIKAVWCVVNSGALTFKDSIGNVIEGFGAGHWVRISMLPNPYD